VTQQGGETVNQLFGILYQDVPVYFDHRARSLWPQELSEQQKIAERYGAHLALDGDTVFF
jgi:hypothetical protein